MSASGEHVTGRGRGRGLGLWLGLCLALASTLAWAPACQRVDRGDGEGDDNDNGGDATAGGDERGSGGAPTPQPKTGEWTLSSPEVTSNTCAFDLPGGSVELEAFIDESGLAITIAGLVYTCAWVGGGFECGSQHLDSIDFYGDASVFLVQVQALSGSLDSGTAGVLRLDVERSCNDDGAGEGPDCASVEGAQGVSYPCDYIADYVMSFAD